MPKERSLRKGYIYMYKELIIILVVLILIIGLDIASNNYTKETVNILTEELNNLRTSILKEEKEETVKKMGNVKKSWKERYKVLAFYIEHDELEKVETQMTELAANIDVEEYKECIAKLDTTIFILEHIQEKEEFHFRSIF